MNIVFVDPKCRTEYDSNVMRMRALGGTESTVVRIATGLSKIHNVRVVQHNRAERLEESATLRFLPLEDLIESVKIADHVIFIQKAQFIDKVAAACDGRFWLWLHNYLEDEVPFYWTDHLRYKLGIICVSHTHALHTQKHLRSLPVYWASMGAIGRGGLLYHYNPIDEDLIVDTLIKRDPYKLVFFSSPHKGIEQVISLYLDLHTKNSNFRLFVANPGYMKENEISEINNSGIVSLGKLPQREILNHVRQALCVFYPQRKRPETFGLVYAESNAVGTPVLAHDFGSAREVLSHNNQPIDASRSDIVTDTVISWSKNGGPSVWANPMFQMSSVIKKWDQFLGNADNFIKNQTS